MILLSQIKLILPITNEYNQLKRAIIHELNIDEEALIDFSIYKKSIDARKKPKINYVYSVLVSTNNDNIFVKRSKNAVIFSPVKYKLHSASDFLSPVIIGAGPAGLFCAYILALSNCKPVIYERGKDVDSRNVDIKTYFETGILNTESNVQFGEGGAGCFSDGKLNTLVKDKFGRNRFVLETFVKFGADPRILYDAKPHIGTDVLCKVIRNMRNEIINLGGEFHFDSGVTDFHIVNGRIAGIYVNNSDYVETDCVVLAIGHSARDTFFKLYERHIDMQAKEFAVGFRVEHNQKDINIAQYGTEFADVLPPAPYKLTHQYNDRGIYSFCMCPGGYVINASSEDNLLAVNGMSYNDRDSGIANSAIIVTVGKNEFDLNDPLGAVKYQRSLEKKAYDLACGAIPKQLFGDFKANRPSRTFGKVVPSDMCKFKLTNLRGVFSDEINECFIDAMDSFNNRIKGFGDDDTVLSGVESRTSSPVRINRNSDFMSNIYGIYPCGEGAGYAGGIMSAAMDGMKVAERLTENNLKVE